MNPDFSKGERGKFYREQARFHIPLYLEEELLSALYAIANRRGVAVDELISEVLKRDLANAEALR